MAGLKILFVTQEDPFYVPQFFREFASVFDPQQVDVVGVIVQKTLGKRSFKELLVRLWRFYGPRDFILVGALYVIFTMLNTIAVLFQGRFPGSFSVTHVALKARWKIIECPDVNAPSFIASVKHEGIDLMVSVAASQIFSDQLLSAPRLGCINVHNSLLPKNRGMMPNFWALSNIDSESVSGMTVHMMNEALDDGPIILQRPLPLDRNESLHHLMKRTKRLNAHLVIEALSILQGGVVLQPNNRSEATYNTFPNKEDVRRFRQKGLRVI
jgi:methionyl-tRNA formyltransferase